MKLKLTSLFLLAISLQSFAMEKRSKKRQKKEPKVFQTQINRNTSLGTLSILPDEMLIKIILTGLHNSNLTQALQMVQALENTSKQFRILACDIAVKKPLLTQALITEINKYKINLDRVKQLILKGADINAKNHDGKTALTVAAYLGRKDIVQFLLNNNAEVNIQDDEGETALTWAAFKGHTDIVKILLQNDADVNIKNNLGFSALWSATQRNHTDILKLLKRYGAQ